MLIIDKGRKVDERSVVLIENGIFQGIGFYNLNFQLSTLEILKSIITPMEDNRDAQHIIQSYSRNRKNLKIIPLEEMVNP
jgi:DNA polymerase-3 subunit epsilon